MPSVASDFNIFCIHPTAGITRVRILNFDEAQRLADAPQAEGQIPKPIQDAGFHCATDWLVGFIFNLVLTVYVFPPEIA